MPKVISALAVALLVVLVSPASASAWRTVATASDASDFVTFASLTKTVDDAVGLRIRVKAPRGRTKVSGSVFCTNEDFDFESRSFGFTYRSTGQVKTRGLPVPLDFAECDVSTNVTGKGGALKIQLQME